MDSVAVNTIREQLDSRLASIVLGSNKVQNSALVFLKEWEHYEDNIDNIISDIILSIQKRFHVDDGQDTAGMTKFTSMVVNIGIEVMTSVSGYPERTEANWKLQVRIGAIFIEILQDLGYILVNKDAPDYVGPSKGAPVVIHATEKWLETFDVIQKNIRNNHPSMYFTKPEPIQGLYDTNRGKPILKRETDSSVFNQLIGTKYLSGLDKVRQTGWQINRDVFNFIMNIPMDTDLPEIPKLGSKKAVDDAYSKMLKEAAKEQKGSKNNFSEAQAEYEKQSLLWTSKKVQLKKRSRIIEQQIIMMKAQGLVDRGEFFYDVDCDYRGRIYYMESYLHYQGSDLPKALLEFSEAKLMTVRGYEWLLIHIASTWNHTFSVEDLKEITWFENDYVKSLEEDGLENISVDKMSLEDRKRWSLSMLDDLLSIGFYGQLIDEAEKPYMLLAACVDLYKYHLATSEGNPYYSRLPIPVDGTSNGLQHTSAITRDRATGSLVGLVEADFPTDLYVKVGQDMMKRNPEFFKTRNMPMKAVRKNLSKRATMTRQYSAGAKKISESMFSDCYKNGATTDYDISAQDCDMLSKVAVESIDEMCPANTAVREFLQAIVGFELGIFQYQFEDGTDATSHASKLKRNLSTLDKDDKEYGETIAELRTLKRVLVDGNGSKAISWTTPSGFPVRCNLFEKQKVELKVQVSKKTYHIAGQWDNENIPKVSKHISAVAANMVHSLDATHLINTADTWVSEGHSNSFGAVHDSFASHASDVDDLIHVIKSEFVKMYDGVDVYQYFIDTILTDSEGFNLEKPELGDLDINEVMKSDYFFA